MRAFTLSFLLLAGCGSKDPATPPDAPASDDAAIDAAIDAPVDAPPAAAALVVNDGTGTVTQWSAPSTFVGGDTTARLYVINTGTVPIGPLTTAITGPDASQFSIVAGTNTCTQLGAGTACSIDVRFAPTAAGTANAVLRFADATLHLDLPLIGPAVIASGGGLTADLAVVTFPTITRDEIATAQLLLSNTSGSTITLGTRTTAAPFSVSSDNCPASLTPGGACTVNLALTGTTIGSATGNFHVASSEPDLDVPLQGIVLRKLTVSGNGFGTGTVVSTPAGINCPGTCSAGFPAGVPVTFTATPDAGNMFVEWSGLCSGATCSVPSPLDGYVLVRFVPTSAKKIAITMTGTSRGYAGVRGSGATGADYGRCTSSCDIYVPVGAQITAYGYSPSTFVGWSGDCTSSTDVCNLGTIAANRAITLTSAADPHEVATLLPAVATTGLAIAPNGNLIVGTSTGVSEMTLAGTTVWSTAIAGGATSLATDAAGHIYGLGGPGVFALSSSGAMMWTRAFTGAPVGGGSLHGSLATSPDGTVIAVLTADGVHAVDGNGVDRFTISGVTPAPQTVAVAPDGTVGLSQIDTTLGLDQNRALRYSNAGTPLATFDLLPGYVNASLAFDPTNAVCGISTGRGHANVFRATAPGVVAFSEDTQFSLNFGVPAGVLTTSSGEVVGIRDKDQRTPLAGGMRLDVFSPTGTSVFTHIKTTNEAAFAMAYYHYDGVQLQHLAAGGTNRIAVSGVYATLMPWIQVYDLP